jgi:hypothetical protein
MSGKISFKGLGNAKTDVHFNFKQRKTPLATEIRTERTVSLPVGEVRSQDVFYLCYSNRLVFSTCVHLLQFILLALLSLLLLFGAHWLLYLLVHTPD